MADSGQQGQICSNARVSGTSGYWCQYGNMHPLNQHVHGSSTRMSSLVAWVHFSELLLKGGSSGIACRIMMWVACERTECSFGPSRLSSFPNTRGTTHLCLSSTPETQHTPTQASSTHLQAQTTCTKPIPFLLCPFSSQEESEDMPTCTPKKIALARLHASP